MNEKLTEIVLVIDRSGSMHKISRDAQGGFNEFIQKQKEVDGEVKVTLVQFDDEIETVYDNEDIGKAAEYVLSPRGGTALLDAIGKTVTLVGERLSKTKEEDRPAKVMVCIITDGEENSSREYTKATVKEMIEHQRDNYAWEFIFIGANMDAFGEAGSIGIGRSASYNTTSIGIRSAFTYSSNITSSYRSGASLDSYDNNATLDS